MFQEEDLAQVIDKPNRRLFLTGKHAFITIIFLIQELGQKVIVQLWNEVLGSIV